jgi:hypothetical protein
MKNMNGFFVGRSKKQNKRMKILYITTTSKLSEAEKMICELAKRINKEKYEIKVCTMTDDLNVELLDILRKKGVETAYLNLDKKWKLWKVFKFRQVQ